MATKPSATPVYVTNGGASEETVLAMAEAIGSTDDAPWNGTDANATIIALLKAIANNTATT